MPTPEDQNGLDLSFELRKNINDAYAFVEGQKSVQTFASVTFEELMDQQIERYIGADTEARPNVLHRVQAIAQNTQQAIAKIKSLPPELFAEANPSDDVNSPVEPPADT